MPEVAFELCLDHLVSESEVAELDMVLAVGQGERIEAIGVGSGSCAGGLIPYGGVDERLATGVADIAAERVPPWWRQCCLARLWLTVRRGLFLSGCFQYDIFSIDRVADATVLEERAQGFGECHAFERRPLIGVAYGQRGIVGEVDFLSTVQPFHLLPDRRRVVFATDD